VSISCPPRPCDPEAERATALSVALQPLTPGDAATVLEVFAGLSDRSRRLRFLSPKPRLTSADLRQLTAVDHHDHVALLAVAGSPPRSVGVARFVRDPGQPRSADVAVAVVDDWQGRGVGTKLTAALVQRARQVGVRRFTMMMSADNEGAVRLLHHASGRIERLAADEHTAEFALDLESPPCRGSRRSPDGWSR
jgi:acetyltransferase